MERSLMAFRDSLRRPIRLPWQDVAKEDRPIALLVAIHYTLFFLAIIILGYNFTDVTRKLVWYVLAMTAAPLLGLGMLAAITRLAAKLDAEPGRFLEPLAAYNTCFGLLALAMLHPFPMYMPGLVLYFAIAFALTNGLILVSLTRLGRRLAAPDTDRVLKIILAAAGALVAALAITLALLTGNNNLGAVAWWDWASIALAGLLLIAAPMLLYRRPFPALLWVNALTGVFFVQAAYLNVILVAAPVVIILAFGLAYLITGKRHPGGSAPGGWWADALVVAWIAAISLQLFFPADRSHYNAFLAAANDVMHGRQLMVNSFSQYGILSVYALAGLFKLGILPFTYQAFSLLNSILYVTQMTVVFVLLRRIVRSFWISFAAVTLMILVNLLTATWQPVAFPSAGPLRYIFMYLLLAAIAQRLDHPARRVLWLVIEHVIIAVQALWSVETLAYGLAGYGALIVFEALFTATDWIEFARSAAKRLGLLLAVAAAPLIVFNLFIYFTQGQWPAWGIYLGIAFNQVTQTTPYRGEVDLWGTGTWVAGTYAFSLIALIAGWFKAREAGKAVQPEVVLMFGMAVIGALYFSHWIAISGEQIISVQAIPALFLITCWLVKLARADLPRQIAFPIFFSASCVLLSMLAVNLADPRLPRRLTPLNWLVRAGLTSVGFKDASMGYDLAYSWTPPPGYHWVFYEGYQPDPLVADTLALINAYAPDSPRAAVFAPPDTTAEVLIRAGRTHSLTFTGEYFNYENPVVPPEIVSFERSQAPQDPIFVTQNFALVPPVHQEYLTGLCQKFGLMPLSATSSGMLAFKLVQPGAPGACSCGKSGVTCPTTVMIPYYTPGDPVILDSRIASAPDQTRVAHIVVGDEYLQPVDTPAADHVTITGTRAGNLTRLLDSYTATAGSTPPYKLWVVQPIDAAPAPDSLGSYHRFSQSTTGFDSVTEFWVSEYRLMPDIPRARFSFGDSLELGDWSLDPPANALKACDRLSVQSWWRATAALANPLSAAVALIDEKGEVASNNGPLGDVDVTRWQPGLLYRDTRDLTIPCDLGSGEYRLVFVVYTVPDVVNLPVHTADGAAAGTFADLGTVNIRR